MKNLRKQFHQIGGQLLILILLPAFATSVFNYAAYVNFLSFYGDGWWIRFLALTAAVAVGALYWIGFAVLLGIVAYAPRADRARVMPVIAIMTAMLLAASSYPNVQVMAGGYAGDIEDKAYVEEAAAKADQIKARVRAFDQLRGVAGNGETTLRDFETRETRGLLSGFESLEAKPGPVSDSIGAQAARFGALKAQLALGQENAAAIIARIDAAVAAMRTALTDKKADPAHRRTAMQEAGDAFRTAAIDLREALPVAAVSTFAQSLQAPQLRPALSGKQRVRAGQLKALEMVEAALKQRGKAIEAVLAGLTGGDDDHAIPPYAPAPASVLVIKHAWQLGNVIAAALAIDLLPLALFLIIARVNDGLRRTRLQDEDLESLSIGEMVRAIRAEQHLKAQRGRAEYGLIDGPYADYLKRKDDGEARQ